MYEEGGLCKRISETLWNGFNGFAKPKQVSVGFSVLYTVSLKTFSGCCSHHQFENSKNYCDTHHKCRQSDHYVPSRINSGEVDSLERSIL